MSTDTVHFLVQAAGVIFIPLLPAVVIYALLPSSTSVSGPFKGLSIRLQGTFAGYFLLVLVLTGLLAERRISEHNEFVTGPRFEMWHLRGEVKFPPSIDASAMRDLQVLLQPVGRPIGLPTEEKRLSFEVNLPVSIEGTDPDEYDIPFVKVVLDHPYTHAVNIELDHTSEFAEYDRTVKRDNHEIQVNEIIDLAELPPGNQEDTDRTTARAESD